MAGCQDHLGIPNSLNSHLNCHYVKGEVRVIGVIAELVMVSQMFFCPKQGIDIDRSLGLNAGGKARFLG